MKILLVGPGIMEIPSKGWGAVETVIWQQKNSLEKQGHTVDILNKRGYLAAWKARPWEYDIVHLHYDDLARFWNRLAYWWELNLVITSHYGYGAWPQKWHHSYRKIFRALMDAPALIVLSQEIRDLYIGCGYRGFIRILPNGTEVDEINFSQSPQKDLICLGKIEPRKHQASLARSFKTEASVHIDFVGPIVDKDFSPDEKYTHYLGTWTRKEVKNNLTNYKALILLSDGEAHALVVGEALAAGLSLIISPEAAANLDRSKPFVHIVNSSQAISTLVEKVFHESIQYRSAAREYVKNNFDWSAIAKKYGTIAKELKEYYNKNSHH